MSSDVNEPVYNGYFDMSGSMNDRPAEKVAKEVKDFSPASNEEVTLFLPRIAEIGSGETRGNVFQPVFDVKMPALSPEDAEAQRNAYKDIINPE
jgi:hypothetical protein